MSIPVPKFATESGVNTRDVFYLIEAAIAY